MSDARQWIERYHRRLAFGRFIERFGEWLAAFLFVFGGVVLTVKLAFPALWPGVLWIGVGVVAAIVGAWAMARREAFTHAESVALLDSRLGAGGLLMTLDEVPEAEWAGRLPADDASWRRSLPRIVPGRFGRLLVLPLVFAVGACFVPLREIKAEPPLVTSTGLRTAESLDEVVDQLEDLKMLEEREREQIRQEIENVREHAEKGPLKEENWETIDALRERLTMRVADGMMQVDKARRAASALARATEPDAPPITPERAEELTEDLVETLRKMSERGDFEGASEGLKNTLQRLMKDKKFDLPQDPAARRELLDELGEFLDQEIDKLAECRGQCQGQGQGQGQCPGGECPGEGPGPDGDGRPGRGGINRGRGDAELTYGDESDEQMARFKEIVLPPGFLEDPGNVTIGTTSRAPVEDIADSAPRGAAGNVDLATGSETPTRPLRPRHQSVVKEYFGRDE